MKYIPFDEYDAVKFKTVADIAVIFFLHVAGHSFTFEMVRIHRGGNPCRGKELNPGSAKITSITFFRFILDSFLTFINRHKLDLRNDTTLLTVSGGVDSIVMAHLFYTMGFKGAITHCNFGLRDKESDEDETFVKRLSAEYGFEFFTKKFATKEFAYQNSVSTQMAARDLRYEWFKEIRLKQGYQWIATAHHANDSFETILLNLARGTGPSGLTGIAEIKGFLVRPLLYASKAEILDYAERNNLKWREDRSNDSDDYKRNLIRHHAVPVFHQLNPSLETTFRKTSEKLQSANELLNEFLQKWKQEVLKTDGEVSKIEIATLLQVSEPLYRLWYILEKFGFGYSQVRQVMNSLGGISGKVFLSHEYTLLIDRSAIVIRRKSNEDDDSELWIDRLEGQYQVRSKILTFKQAEINSNAKANMTSGFVLLEVKKLQLPLKVRKWKRGDTFQPFGMNGKSKKLSDLFTDLKLDRFQKEEVRLLINGNEEIIWVIGIRSDERYRTDGNSGNRITVSIGQP